MESNQAVEGAILFSIHGPMFSASSDATERDRVYKLLTGKSGKRWVVAVQPNAEENIYVDGGPGSRGMAGRTLSFKLEDGSTVDFIGPWKTEGASLFEDTGFDVRGQTYVRGIVALKRKNAEKYYQPDEYSEILHYDAEPVLRDPADYRKLAQEHADRLGVNVFFAEVTKGCGCAGCQQPKERAQ